MPNFFFQQFWAGLTVWVAFYISDYALTLVGARLYRNGAQNKIAFEGSYELTPYYQEDIDSFRIVSSRFIIVLLLTGIGLYFVWEATRVSTPSLYPFLLGVLIGPELSVHVRHLSNVFLFGVAKMEAVRGNIQYSRVVALQMSSIQKLSFAGLFVIMFAFTGSWFTLGCGIGCLSIADKHRRMAARQKGSNGSCPKEPSATAGLITS